ncbi:Na+/H+ antiporter NhaA [Pseudoxanthomonas sp. Soil82]|uniref:Na+/H+ antiporter NhaA n=1 Tax=Pseudoxanthomonas sp. Soil82 TaxID=3157341 RepID=UPI00338DC6D7
MRARLRGSGTRATRGEDLSRLPYASVDRLARPFLYFVRVEAMAGVVLLASTAAALALANSPWSQAFIGLWQLPVGVSVGGAGDEPLAPALDQRRADDVVLLRHLARAETGAGAG